MKPVTSWLLGQGVCMIIFSNDILVLVPTIETLNQHARMTIRYPPKESYLWDAHRFLNDGICFAEGRKREYPQGVLISFAEEAAFHQANVAGVGPPGVYSPGHLACPLALSPSPNCRR